MKKAIITIAILCSITGITTAQESDLNNVPNVSNIRVQQQDTLLIVMYDLETKSDIEVFVSFDNGLSYRGPLKELTGAAGKNMAAEKDKMFIWNIVKEYGYIEYPNTIIKITANSKTSLRDNIASIIKPEPEPVEEEPEDYKSNAFGLDFGYGALSNGGGSMYDIGIRYLHNYNPYFGVDFFKVKVNGYSDAANIQLLTGLRGYTPRFGKNMCIYSAFRLGGGLVLGNNMFGGGFGYEFEIGMYLSKTFFIAFAYNHQGGNVDVVVTVPHEEAYDELYQYWSSYYGRYMTGYRTAYRTVYRTESVNAPFDAGYSALRIGFDFGKSNSTKKHSSSEDDYRKNQFGLDFGYGARSDNGDGYLYGQSYVDFGLRWLHNFNPYIGLDIVNLKIQLYSGDFGDFDEHLLQLLTGIRGYSPTFGKILKAYASLKFGFGDYGFDDFGAANEFEIGMHIGKKFFVGYVYNMQRFDNVKCPYNGLRLGFNF